MVRAIAAGLMVVSMGVVVLGAWIAIVGKIPAFMPNRSKDSNPARYGVERIFIGLAFFFLFVTYLLPEGLKLFTTILAIAVFVSWMIWRAAVRNQA